MSTKPIEPTLAAQRDALRWIRSNLARVPALAGNSELVAWADRFLLAAEAARGAPIVWRYLGATADGRDRFETGVNSERLTFATRTRAVWWAWAAVDDQARTQSLRAEHLAAPDAGHPIAAARKAIRTEARRDLEERGLRELAAACRSITVRDDGQIVYVPAPRAPTFATR